MSKILFGEFFRMICKLCGKNDDLRNSHIIPRSIYKNLKKDIPQLIEVICDVDSIPKKTNSNPTEKLLCSACEQILSDKYERYGTRIFRTSNGVKKTSNYVELSNFTYKIFYLYLISVLWKGSISTLPEFSGVNLGKKMEDILSSCIKNNSIKLGTSLNLDNLILISVMKVIDTTNEVNQDIIDNLLISLNMGEKNNNEDDHICYWMTNGFIIIYYFKIHKDLFSAKQFRIHGQIKKGAKLKIPKVEIWSLKEIHRSLDIACEKARKYEI